MRALWVVTLAVVALVTTQGCKRKEPIPGPKAGFAAASRVHLRTPGIAWFQESFEEAFSRPRPAPRKVAPRRELQCDSPVRPVSHLWEA